MPFVDFETGMTRQEGKYRRGLGEVKMWKEFIFVIILRIDGRYEMMMSRK